MNNNIVYIFFVFVFLFLGSFRSSSSHQYIIKRIVIDAGHGGKDPGALGQRKTKEKDIALKIALKLGKLIEKNFKHVQVFYTRKTDKFIALYERAKIANTHKADLFISIHCNASENKKVFGTETYVMGLHTSAENLSVAKRENKVILMENKYTEHYQGFDPNIPSSHILFSLCQNAYNKHSIHLAQNIEKQFKQHSKRKSLGVKQAGFLVLWKTYLPSVLVEVGFLSNLQEEKYLQSALGQTYIASSIFRAIRTYKNNMENV